MNETDMHALIRRAMLDAMRQDADCHIGLYDTAASNVLAAIRPHLKVA